MKRLIKYAALIFALILSASIIGGCLFAGVTLIRELNREYSGSTNPDEETNSIWYRDERGDIVFFGIKFGNNYEVKSGSEQFAAQDIHSVYTEFGSGNWKIEVWENNSISVDYEDIPTDYQIYNSNGTLIIKREKRVFNFGNPFATTPKLTIRVPAGTEFKSVEVFNGSGRLELSDITAGELLVDSGSGTANIFGVTTKKSVFDTGSGSFTVKNSDIGDTAMDTGSGSVNFENIAVSNLVMESGSGRVDVSGILTGNCVFDSGSGSINVVIYGEEEEYNIRADLGSGGFYLNGEKEKDTDISHKNANHLLIFDSGSGRVSLTFKEAQNGHER